jgi:nucleoside-diphosphate-sugar epimerase
VKVLVTGGGGFIGRYIVEKLVARGFDVTSLSRGDHPELDLLGVKTARADVAEREKVITALSGMDVVFHTAARVGVGGGWDGFHRANVIGSRNVVEACVANGVKRLIFTSSPSVVFGGEPSEGTDETAPYPARFNSYYPWTKAIAERETLTASGKGGLLTCAIRPHLVWGPRDTNLIPRLLARADAGRLAMVGGGRNLVDMVYVENAADAHILAMDRLFTGSPVAGSAYFITQGEPVNLWDWINRILARLGRPPVKRRVSYPLAYAGGAVMETAYRLLGLDAEPPMTRFVAQQLAMSHHFDIGKARRELGYEPAVSAQEGLDRLAESLGR